MTPAPFGRLGRLVLLLTVAAVPLSCLWWAGRVFNAAIAGLFR